MQLPTHVLAGVFIQLLINTFVSVSQWIEILLIIGFCVISHFLIDAIAKITYHPPTREPGNFWLYWHIFVYIFGFFLIFLYIQVYWLGILSALIVDIWDWYILRNYANRISQPDWGKKYYLHPIVDKIRGQLCSRLPNLNYYKIGIIPELFLYLVWFILFIFTL